MLWQSSLLMAVVFALDALLARRVRAAVRHALWIVVLIKLVLPPALAFPTAAAWWLWPAKPPLTPVFKNTIVTIDAAAPPVNFVPQTIPTAPPPPKLSIAGIALLAAAAISAGLLSWLVFRWLGVARKIRNSSVPVNLAGILEEVRQSARVRRCPRLKLIDDAQSPAVYGLFRPVILLPRALAEKLSPMQLRAVLLHEVIHLRRGDVWIHFAQMLLQIAYWWHPLLWFANGRIRRLREEAVDDAVMLALGDDSEDYAPTLLDVAKYAFHRPPASLGLIGILESRSALRRRIERLTDFRPPRRAGLTLLSLFGIAAFSAVALPMGQAPVAGEKPASTQPASDIATNTVNQNNLTTFKIANPIPDEELNELLSQAGVKIPPTIVVYLENNGCLLVRGNADQEARVRSIVLKLNRNFPPPTNYLNRPRLAKRAAEQALGTNVVRTDSQRQILYRKLNRIQFSVSYNDVPLSRVLDDLHEKSVLQDPEKTGIHFLFNPNIGGGPGGGLRPINPVTGLPDKTAAIPKTADPTRINISLSLNNVTLADLLNAICLVSDHPIQYSVEDYGIVFSEKGPGPEYEMRTFKVDPNTFHLGLQNALSVGSGQNPGGAGTTIPQNIPGDSNATVQVNMGGILYVTTTNLSSDVSTLAKEIFERLGVNLDPPKNVFFNERLGVLFVYATPKDLDVIEKAVEVLNQLPVSRQNNKTISYPISANPPYYVRAVTSSADLENRIYPVDYYGFQTAVYKATGETNTLNGFRKLASQAGVDLSPPKTVVLDGLNILIVSATKKDLDALVPVIADLHCPPPQVHIKARFIEVPKAFLSKANKEFPAGLTNGGVLTADEMKSFLRQIKSDKGVVELAEPEGTTIGGVRIQLQATEDEPVITNPGSPVPKIGYLESGPLFDAHTMILRHERLYLTAKASLIEWFGYPGLTNAPVRFATNAAGKITIQPNSRHPIPLSQAYTENVLRDGETLVLFPKSEQLLYCEPNEKRAVTEFIRRNDRKYKNKVLVAFITMTLVDAAGNRLNSNNQISPNRMENPPVRDLRDYDDTIIP